MSSGTRRNKLNFILSMAEMVNNNAVGHLNGHARSSSLPPRPHPLALHVEEGLHALKACVASPSVKKICSGLKGLGDLYGSIEELLCLPSSHQQKKWVEEELDVSVRVLDLCGALRDLVSASKEQAQDLQLALRKKQDNITANKAQSFIGLANKSKKSIKNCLRELRKMDGRCGVCSSSEADANLQMMVVVSREAREMTISLVQSIVSLAFKQCSKQKSRWSFVSKALQKRKVACEVEHEDVSGVVSMDFSKGCSQEQLVAWEEKTQRLENELECLIRRLIQNRVSLLNILSL